MQNGSQSLHCAQVYIYEDGMPYSNFTQGNFIEDGLSEGGEAEVGVAEVGSAEVGIAEVGEAKVGSAEVSFKEVGSAEVGSAEVGIAEVGSGALMPYPPRRPDFASLFEQLKLFLVSHFLSLLFFAFRRWSL